MEDDLFKSLDDEMRRIAALDMPAMHVTLQKTRERILADSKRAEGDGCYESALLLIEASHRLGAAALIIGSKIRSLAVSGIGALERQELLVLAFVARAIIEHSGTAAHLVQIAKKRYNDALKNPSKKSIEQNFKLLEKKMNQFFLGSSTTGSTVSPIHVNDGIADLEKEAPGTKNMYDELCDFVHPNYGANSVVCAGNSIDDVLLDNCLAERVAPIRDKLYSFTLKAFSAAQNQDLILLSMCVLIEDLAERLIHPTSKSPNSAFADKKMVVKFDGKTPETALLFEKARTWGEVIDELNKFLEKNGMEKRGRMAHGIVDGRMVDCYETNKGPLYVSMPLLAKGVV
ncbi:MAG TPA: hypothetical protein VE954_10225 [Oligoflexus sp.]|uniref:hypothetical protein n=1 Tax=Oligoflexus sp. TaxID=1971216 RepID=UPI002D2B99C0|nr:hypothetical protein [Oligoflexus sp.]HYX33479.1 hypothetical protein [Oligoflexus sp.]